LHLDRVVVLGLELPRFLDADLAVGVGVLLRSTTTLADTYVP
jgi:hypothetical protein